MFFEKLEKKNMQEMMMTNPEFMQGMMRQQLGGLLPQVRRRCAPTGCHCRGVHPPRVPLASSTSPTHCLA